MNGAGCTELKSATEEGQLMLGIHRLRLDPTSAAFEQWKRDGAISSASKTTPHSSSVRWETTRCTGSITAT